MVPQAERFQVARRALMLPHRKGENESIAEAMHSIMLVIDRDLPAELCDDSAAMLRELASLVSTDGESHLEKAASLSDDDRIQFSRLVDELASEFLRLEALSA